MKTKTIKILERDFCIIKYRKLPLTFYIKEIDEDIFYYPEIESFYWIKLADFDNQRKDTSKKLISQIIKLVKILEFEKIIFLGEINKPWVSKITSKRKDYKPLIKSLEYFKENKIWGKFNGGVEVSVKNLKQFLPHYFMITRCDGGFFDFHFTDEKENIIFYIHYSGEIKIMTLNKKYNEKFKKAVKLLDFIDSSRNGSEKI